MKIPELQCVKKREVGRLIHGEILPKLADPRFAIVDQQTLTLLCDELVCQIVSERSGLGRSLYLDALICPIYVPHDIDALPGTFGGRSHQLAPGTPMGFDMRTEEEIRGSTGKMIEVIRDHLIPFLDLATSSRELLRLFETGSAPPVFPPGRDDWHGCFLMGFVAAYCREMGKGICYFDLCREEIGDHKAYWVAPRLEEMTHLESLLTDPIAVREHLATNAFRLRKLLKLPFSFDPTVYGLPTTWVPRNDT
ncbi:MAG: hypothetical protein AABZ12_08555 [Planctomycetota bacterium]